MTLNPGSLHHSPPTENRFHAILILPSCSLASNWYQCNGSTNIWTSCSLSLPIQTSLGPNIAPNNFHRPIISAIHAASSESSIPQQITISMWSSPWASLTLFWTLCPLVSYPFSLVGSSDLTMDWLISSSEAKCYHKLQQRWDSTFPCFLTLFTTTNYSYSSYQHVHFNRGLLPIKPNYKVKIQSGKHFTA